MKFLFFSAIFFMLYNTIIAQQKPSCHSTEEFAMMASDAEFRAEHSEPNDHYYSGPGETITFKTSDGKEAKAFLIKAAQPTNNFLFVFHEWWGLNDLVKEQAARFQKDLGNVNVVALDLYDGKVTNKRDEAGQLMQALKTERAEAIIQGAIKHAGENAKITTVGWCLGGGWSLQASLLSGTQAKGCIIYYGMPENNVERLKQLNADVLGIYASQDGWITQEMVKEFNENMQAAGKRFDVVTFDADHAFANPSNPNFDKEATEKAYKYSLEFLRERL